jgi:hypothetical protein
MKKEEILKRSNEELKIECLLCHKRFKHLGSHIWHAHGLTAREYKGIFGLPYKWGLISEEVREKKRKIANWQKTWKKNFKNWRKYAFKKGEERTKIQRKTLIALRDAIERIKKVNEEVKKEWKRCPVCGMGYHHLESHLFNKHGLIRIEKIKKLLKGRKNIKGIKKNYEQNPRDNFETDRGDEV